MLMNWIQQSCYVASSAASLRNWSQEPKLLLQRQTILVKKASHINNPGNNGRHKELFFVTHSGLGNQAVGIQNALQIAWILKRRLILPPILDHRLLAFGGQSVSCRTRQLSIIDDFVRAVRMNANTLLDWHDFYGTLNNSYMLKTLNYKKSSSFWSASSNSRHLLVDSLICRPRSPRAHVAQKYKTLVSEALRRENESLLILPSTFAIGSILHSEIFHDQISEMQTDIGCFFKLLPWISTVIHDAKAMLKRYYAVHVRLPDGFSRLSESRKQALLSEAALLLNSSLGLVLPIRSDNVYIASQVPFCSFAEIKTQMINCVDFVRVKEKLNLLAVPSYLVGMTEKLYMFFEQSLIANAEGGLIAAVVWSRGKFHSAVGRNASAILKAKSSYTRFLGLLWQTQHNPRCST